MNYHGLEQLVHFPTREKNTLDLILTTLPGQFKDVISPDKLSAFRKLSSIYVFSYFPFGFEGRIWDLNVSVPDHCLSFYF